MKNYRIEKFNNVAKQFYFIFMELVYSTERVKTFEFLQFCLGS